MFIVPLATSVAKSPDAGDVGGRVRGGTSTVSHAEEAETAPTDDVPYPSFGQPGASFPRVRKRRSQRVSAMWIGIGVGAAAVVCVVLIVGVLMSRKGSTPSVAGNSSGTKGDTVSVARAVAGKSHVEDAKPALPADFAFLPFTQVTHEVNVDQAVYPKIGSEIVGTCKLRNVAGGIEFWFKISSGRDAVQGLHGNGLKGAVGTEGDMSRGDFRAFTKWTPEPFACYRDRRLLGIWDPQLKALRATKPDEAVGDWDDAPVASVGADMLSGKIRINAASLPTKAAEPRGGNARD